MERWPKVIYPKVSGLVTLYCDPTREVEEVALPLDRPMEVAQEDCWHHLSVGRDCHSPEKNCDRF